MAKVILMIIVLIVIVSLLAIAFIRIRAELHKHALSERLELQAERNELISMQNDIDFAASQLEKSLQRLKVKDKK